MRICILLFLALPLFAVKLVEYNVYDRDDRVDLMLSFDATYTGSATQERKGNIILLSLSDLEYNKEETKELKSALVKKILISSKNGKTSIMLDAKENVSLNISSINNKFGLRIRAMDSNAITTATTNLSTIPSNNSQFTFQDDNVKPKQSSLEGFDFTNYIFILAVLFIILIVLYLLKRNVTRKSNFNIKDFQVVFQRPLDRNNQFTILQYNQKRYVMIIGSSNIILEVQTVKPEEQTFKEEKNFDSFFEENKQRLQNLIKSKQKN